MATKIREGATGIAWPFESALLRGSLGMHLAITLMGVNVGGFAAWLAAPLGGTVLGLPVAVWVAVATGGGATVYLSYKRVPSEVVGGGLYLLASLLLVKPFTVYVTSLRTTGIEQASLLLDAAHSMVAAGILVPTLLLVGWMLTRRAERVARKRRKEQLRQI